MAATLGGFRQAINRTRVVEVGSSFEQVNEVAAALRDVGKACRR